MKNIITSMILAVGLMPAAFAMEHNNNQISNNNSEEKTDPRFRNLFYELPPEVVANITEKSLEDLPRTSQQLLANVTAQRLGKDKLHLGNSAIEQLALELKRRIDENPRIIIDRGIDALLKDVLKSNADNEELLKKLTAVFESYLINTDFYAYGWLRSVPSNYNSIDTDTVYRLPEDQKISAIAFSDDSIVAVSSNGKAYYVGSKFEEKECLKEGKKAFIDPSGRFFAMSYQTPGLIIYDLKHDIKRILVGCNEELSGINFSAQGNYIAGIANNEVFVWQCSTGKLLYTIKEEFKKINGVSMNEATDELILDCCCSYGRTRPVPALNWYSLEKGLDLKTREIGTWKDQCKLLAFTNQYYIYFQDQGSECFINTLNYTDLLGDGMPAAKNDWNCIAACPAQSYYAKIADNQKIIILQQQTDLRTELIGGEDAEKIIFNVDGSQVAALSKNKRLISVWKLPKFITNKISLKQMLFMYALNQYYKGLAKANRRNVNEFKYPNYSITSTDIEKLLFSATFKEFSLQDRKILEGFVKNCKFPSKYLKKFRFERDKINKYPLLASLVWTMRVGTGSVIWLNIYKTLLGRNIITDNPFNYYIAAFLIGAAGQLLWDL